MTGKTRPETVLWLIVCMAGNVYQIGQISEVFFSYKVTTSTSVLFPQKLEPPSMVHSYYLLSLVKWEELFKAKPRLREELNLTDISIEDIGGKFSDLSAPAKQKLTATLFKDMKIDQLMNLTYGPNEILSKCDSINTKTMQKNGPSKCTDHFKIDTFFHDFMYRDLVMEPKNAEIDFMSVKMATGTPGFLYSINLNTSIIKNGAKRMPMTYNVRGNKFSVGFSEFVMLRDTAQWVLMSFALSKSHLLQEPFETSCTDYNSHGFKGRGDCYDQCALQLSLEKLDNKVYPGPDVDANLKRKPFSIPDLLSNQSMVDIVRNITDKCNYKCREYECLSQILVPSIDSTFPAPNNPSIVTLILREPAIDTVYSQSLGMIEYVTAAASTLGFWIGLSIFHFLDLFKSLFTIITEYLMRSGRNNRTDNTGRSELKGQRSRSYSTQVHISQGQMSQKSRPFDPWSFERRLRMDTKIQVLTLLSHNEARWQQRADRLYVKKNQYFFFDPSHDA